MMKYKLDDLITFTTVARTGSFKATAKLLGKDPSIISRRITQLEHQLGVKLLVRTTRSLKLTEAGNIYSNRLSMALEEVDSATKDIGNFIATPQGTLRLSLPVIFGRKIITPLFSNLLDNYPKINIEVHYEDRVVDIVAEGYDLVIRIGSLLNSSLISKKLGVFTSLLVATPKYISTHGIPDTPKQLEHHQCLGFSKAPSWPLWALRAGKIQEAIQPNCSLIADSSEAVLVSALQGMGIALIPDWMASEYLKEGSLINILPAWRSNHEVEIHALMPPGRLIPPKTRVFIDMLVTIFPYDNGHTQ